MKRVSVILALFVCIVQAREVMNLMEPEAKTVYLNLGLDPAFVAGVGYAQSIPIPILNRNLTLTGEAAVPVLLPDLKDYQLQAGSRIPLIGYNNLVLVNRLNLKLSANQTWMFYATGFSLEEGILLGYFHPRFFVAGEFDYTKFLVTYYQHTEEYREEVYKDANDGWYGNTGGMLTVGLQGGFSIGRFELGLRAGAFKTERWNFPSGFPFQANLTMNYHL
ncbi:hypothetical protein JXM67_01295 [candidate division WOR-3 bacterium]|nr:hypothetical protein [candidate division WOR-3 bacterium]